MTTFEEFKKRLQELQNEGWTVTKYSPPSSIDRTELIFTSDKYFQFFGSRIYGVEIEKAKDYGVLPFELNE